jgi:hypothetical protein
MAAVIATLPFSATAGALPEVWFAPLKAYTNQYSGPVGVSDYQDLFAPDANWARAASKVRVFKFLVNYLRGASDDDLRRAIAYLNQRHIALAVEIGLLHDAPACPHVEGHDVDQVNLARRIQRLGGELAYIAADEPLYFGSEGNPKPNCNQNIEDLARQAAETAKAFRSVFPNVKFVDIEPVSNFKDPDLAGLIARWHAAFAAAFGEPFVAFNFDIDWQKPWQDRVRSIATQMRRERMPVAIICDGNPKDATDAIWLANARAHCDAFAQAIGGRPDIVVLQSWFARPAHVLPESDPNSFTHLILDYAGAAGK